MIKIAYFYWGGGPLSYLRYLTIKSFRFHNPNWKIILYMPQHAYVREPAWVSPEHKIKYIGPDYMEAVRNLVEIRTIDFVAMGFRNDVHEAQKSDFLRWWLLKHCGGLWLDLDILFIKSIIPITRFKFAILADGMYFYVAYIYSEPDSKAINIIYQKMFEPGVYDTKEYQCYGNKLVKRCLSTVTRMRATDAKSVYLHPRLILPIYKFRELPTIFVRASIDMRGSIGLHWYGGHPTSASWENILCDPDVLNQHNSYLCKIAKEIAACSV